MARVAYSPADSRPDPALKEEPPKVRDHNKAFCRAAAESFDCPGPVYEFGSYQVEGQEGYANLRGLFPGKAYVGCDFREGPGVDRVEDVSRMTLPDACAGTVLCIETFEHVFEVRRAFDEVFRVLRPGGIFLITSPLNFRIHGYPDDYWRMTPSCLRRMLGCYGAVLSGFQGHAAFPHTVMALAVKTPAPADFAARAERLQRAYGEWLRQTEQAIPLGTKLRRAAAMLYRSKGERRHLADYYKAEFCLDLQPAGSLARAG
jgi:SAM-dependent methyltransferase